MGREGAREVADLSPLERQDEHFAQALLGCVEKGARAALGDEGYDTAVRKGEAMARDEAIELALSITPD